MTGGQALTGLVFISAGWAGVVYGISLWSQAAAWVAGGLMCVWVGSVPFLRSLR